MNIPELLERIDHTKAWIDARRPLVPEEVKELDAYFRIGTTYSSNALEGNTLTLSETKVILEDGLTVGGKPLRDCYEAVGHAKAAQRDSNPGDESFIRLIAECVQEAQQVPLTATVKRTENSSFPRCLNMKMPLSPKGKQGH